MVIPAGLIDGKKDIRYGYPKHIYLDENVNDGNYFTEKTIPISEKNITAFSPLILLMDVVNPSIDFTYERKLNNHFTLQGRLSHLIPYSLLFGTEFKNLTGLRWGGEIRYFVRNNAPKGFYLSLEVNKLSAKYNTTKQFTPNLLSKTDEDYYWDNFVVKKRTLNFNLKSGYQFIHKRLVFDVYGGLGIKDRNVAHLHRNNLNDTEVPYRHPNIYQISNKKGHTTGINLIFNSRIGFTF